MNFPKSTQEHCKTRVIHQDRVDRALKNLIDTQKLYSLSAIFKALGDPTRLKIIMALLNGEMCVCDLAAFLNVTESAVSHQLRKLRDLSLVRPRRSGQVLYYNLDDDHVGQLVNVGLTHISEPK